MPTNDWAIVIGITTYPDYDSLGGPENDANAFYSWLIAPNGGDLDPARIDLIVSSKFQSPGAPPSRQPHTADLEGAFAKLHSKGVGANGVPKSLGRRLYVYAAGHGVGLPFAHDPDQADAALLTAEASRWSAPHLLARIYALYFLNAGIFDEIAVFMDCCRGVQRLNPRFPPYIDVNAVGNQSAQRRTFFAYATRWDQAAREKNIGGQQRGVFTTALLKGLSQAGADASGRITSTSLRNYLMNHMKDLLSPAELADDVTPKEPDIPPPAVDLVFGTGLAAPSASVMVSAPAVAAGQPIRIRGDGFKIVESGQLAANATWTTQNPLPRGNYLAEIPTLSLEKDFSIVGTGGVANVIIP